MPVSLRSFFYLPYCLPLVAVAVAAPALAQAMDRMGAVETLQPHLQLKLQGMVETLQLPLRASALRAAYQTDRTPDRSDPMTAQTDEPPAAHAVVRR